MVNLSEVLMLNLKNWYYLNIIDTFKGEDDEIIAFKPKSRVYPKKCM